MAPKSQRSFGRRALTVTLAAALGLGLGAGLAGFVQRHNRSATDRWRAAAVAHDALIEVTTLEAIRAELASAGQFDRDRLVLLWQQHAAKANELLANDAIRELDPGAVANAERWMSLYSAAANRQVATMFTDPDRAVQVSRAEVIPTFASLQEALTELRLELDKLGPNAQARVDRDLRLLLPGLAMIATVIAGVLLAARRRAAVQAAESRRDARFRAIVQGASDVLTVVGRDARFVEVSPAGERLFGRALGELNGSDPTTVLDPSDATAWTDALTSVVETGRQLTLTVRVRHTDGRYRTVELTGSSPDELDGTAWVWHDVSAQTELAEQLRRNAFVDDLTGLANRALLRDRTTMALAEPTSVSMLLVDVDRFQHFNDAYGHGAGDEILRTIAGRVRACVRPGDTVARLGSDEFAALLSAADPRAVDAVAERILEACRQPLTIDGVEVRATVSIGIATAQRGSDVEELLRRSDTALSVAKAAGRNRSQLHSEALDSRSRQRAYLSSELHHAVSRNQLVDVYQPIVALGTGEVSGFESLLRWRHPELGLVSPMDFIPLAEDNGTIIDIGRWILDQAVARAASTPAPLRMNVNLSARQLVDPSLVGDVKAALERHSLDPSRLVLEITESLLLDDADAMIAVLQQLRDLGCLLAIDDFGTGYSSLGYLRRLPVNIVKLDKSFLDARSSTSDGERAFLESVLHMGRTLGLETVAEGIEDIETSELLRSIGCDKGQGYLFSKPVDRDAVDALTTARYETGFAVAAG